MKTIKSQFEAINKLKIFEIEVINNRTQENDYVIFEIYATEFQLIAQHESMNDAQSKSDKIAYCAVNIDEDLSIDQNIQELYDECINTIIESEYFTLAD